jgi:hypothetical protein
VSTSSFMDECSGPSTEAVPPVGGDGGSVAPPSFPSPTSAIESATEAARIEPVAASEGLELDAITAEAGLIPEIEDVVVAPIRKKPNLLRRVLLRVRRLPLSRFRTL